MATKIKNTIPFVPGRDGKMVATYEIWLQDRLGDSFDVCVPESGLAISFFRVNCQKSELNGMLRWSIARGGATRPFFVTELSTMASFMWDAPTPLERFVVLPGGTIRVTVSRTENNGLCIVSGEIAGDPLDLD